MPPAVSQGRVVFGTHDGLVIAASARDGTRAWVTDIARVHCVVAGGPRGDRLHRLVRLGTVSRGQGQAWRRGRPGPHQRTCPLALQRRERRGEPGDRGRPALLLGLSKPQRIEGVRDEARRGPSRHLEPSPPEQGRLQPVASRPQALHLGLRPARLQLRRLERTAPLEDDCVRGRRGGARPARPSQPRPPQVVDRGRVLRDAGGGLRPRVRRRHRRGLLRLRRTHGRASLEPAARGLDLRIRCRLEGEGVRRHDCRDRSTRCQRETARCSGGATWREDPRLADRDERPRLYRHDPPRDVRAERPHGRDRVAASPTVTTPRSSSPARAGSSSARGGSTRSRTRRAVARAAPDRARRPPPRAPRARRAGTARSRTRRPRRRPPASPSRSPRRPRRHPRDRGR